VESLLLHNLPFKSWNKFYWTEVYSNLWPSRSLATGPYMEEGVIFQHSRKQLLDMVM
jgi:hypothetical protein